MYKSTNANSCSATFTPLAGGLPAQSTMGRGLDLGLSPNYASDNTVYASIASADDSSSTNLGVWLTTNGGTLWTQTAAPDVCQEQCWYDDVVKVDPNNKSIAFFGGAAVADGSGNPIWVREPRLAERAGRQSSQMSLVPDSLTLTLMRWPFSSFQTEKFACIWATMVASGGQTTPKFDHCLDEPERFAADVDAVLSVDFYQSFFALRCFRWDAGQRKSKLSERHFLGR